MKPTPNSPEFHPATGPERRSPTRRVSISAPDAPGRRPALQSPVPLLVFGAHPDDIEFACGGVIARETSAGRAVHFVICSHGEAGSYGTPKQRVVEAKKAAALLGATIEFLKLDGDAHLEVRAAHAIKLAGIFRRIRPEVVLAPSVVENQHPDHARLGKLVRDAARLARFGGLKELRRQKSHAIGRLFYYAVTTEAEPRDITPILIDVSAPKIVFAWTAAMRAHASQTSARKYVELQLARARLWGMRAGVEHAIALFPNEPLVFDSLAETSRGACSF
jgi:LmbE family N-acetylglucosaminyl deacetylase